jgi:hypothetical protein
MSQPLHQVRSRYYSEKFKSYGENNPDKTFYIIRRRPPAWGFFSNLFYVLQGLDYAEKHGYVPLVDMENYWVSELSSLKQINGTKNAWCYFFDQVSKHTLQEAYTSKNVILSDGTTIYGRDHWLSNRTTGMLQRQDLLRICGKLIKKYISTNSVTTSNLKVVKNNLKWDPKNTLGVFIRGTHYYHNLPFPNGTVPSMEFFIAEVKKFISEKSIENVYISTENYRVYYELKKELKVNNLIPSIRYNKKLDVNTWEKEQSLTYDYGIRMGYEKTQNYLIEAILLAECDNFIGTFSNASVFAVAASNLEVGDRRIVMSDKVIFLD